MLFKFEIGLKLAGLLSSRPGFFSNGVTKALLYMVGKQPCPNDRFASTVMISANKHSQDLMTDVGTKSSGDDLA
jgi:hypothetical protein